MNARIIGLFGRGVKGKIKAEISGLTSEIRKEQKRLRV
jgi:hypothetical protein